MYTSTSSPAPQNQPPLPLYDLPPGSDYYQPRLITPPNSKPAWNWLIIVGVVTGVFALVSVVLASITSNLTTEGQLVYQGFLTNAAKGEVAQAYQAFTPALQSQYTQKALQAEFVPVLADLAGVQSLNTTTFNLSTLTSGQRSVYLAGTAKLADQSTVPFRVTLLKTGNLWQIEAFQLDRFSVGNFIGSGT